MRGIDLTGQKFNRLTAIKYLRKSSKGNVWLLKCDCGNEIERASGYIRSGSIKSCGCLHSEYIQDLNKSKTLPNKMGPINKLFGRYRREGEQRDYEFNLNKDEFTSLIFSNCHYCDSEPFTELCIVKEKNTDNTIIYNGIDRKNNSLDYTVENCVPCCIICNRMKMDLDYNSFIQQVEKIYQRINK